MASSLASLQGNNFYVPAGGPLLLVVEMFGNSAPVLVISIPLALSPQEFLSTFQQLLLMECLRLLGVHIVLNSKPAHPASLFPLAWILVSVHKRKA